MKRLFLISAALTIAGILSACGGNDTSPDGTGMNENTQVPVDPIQIIQPDETDSDDQRRFEHNELQDDEYMREDMSELNFTELSVEATFQDRKEFEAELDVDPNKPIYAEVEDEVNDIEWQGKDAFDYIFQKTKNLNITSDSSREEVIKQVVEVFNFPNDYVELEVEITFNDGKKIDIEDKNKQ